MLDTLYENIGGKIKNLAKWIFIIEAIGAIITGFVLLIDRGFEDKWWALFIIFFVPIVAWVGSWILYAFGELVESEMYYEIIKKKLYSLENKNGISLVISVPRGAMSKAIGQRKINKTRLIEEFNLKEIRFVEDDSIKAFDDVSVQERKKAECI